MDEVWAEAAGALVGVIASVGAADVIGAAFSPEAERRVVERAAEVVIAAARAKTDIRYQALAYDPRATTLRLEGLSVADAEQTATVESLSLRFGPGWRVEATVDGLSAPLGALDLAALAPEIGLDLQLALLGLERPTLSGAAVFAYDPAASGVTASGHFEAAELARLDVEAAVVGLHLVEGEPGGAFERLDIQLGDAGLVARLGGGAGAPLGRSPMADIIAAGAAATALEALAPGVDRRAAPASVRRAVDGVEAAATAFLTAGRTVSLSLRPETAVAFADFAALDQEPRLRAAFLNRLRPVAAPGAPKPPVLLVDLAAADAVTAARALLSGVGAPRSPAAARDRLADAATGAELAARAEAHFALGALSESYRDALRAEALGEAAARALVVRLRALLEPEDQLAVEAALYDADAAAVAERRAQAEAGDSTAMRALAEIYASGRGAPRHAARAYYWALLAAAAGDAAAPRLRDGVAARAARGDAQGRAAWAAMLAAVEAEAVAAWAGGLAARIAVD